MYMNNSHWGISIKFYFLLEYTVEIKKKHLRESIIPVDIFKKIEEASKRFSCL